MALAGLMLFAAGAAAQGPPAPAAPTVPRDTPYQVARRLLFSLGYAPAVPARPRCAEGREEICRAYGEVERCAADGPARCLFLWSKDGAMIEVETRGLDDLTVQRVRCRTGCG
ncbi:MAG TPA: hypothetical protein VF744_09575 [Beijerinckiaceae bacterium]|jgi:hypothetical protein